MPLAGPSTTPRDVKKLSDIPEEALQISAPERRPSRRRPVPSPPTAIVLRVSPGNSPNLDSQEQVELYTEGKKHYNSGMHFLKRGKSGVGDAKEQFRSAYEIFMDLNREDRAASALGQLCWCHGTLAFRAAKAKDFDAALSGYEETRVLYRALADMNSGRKADDARAKEAMALFQLGVVSAEVKDLIGATAALKEASTLFALIRREPEEAMCFCELATLLTRRDPATALHYFKLALLIFCKLGDSHKEARALFSIGALAASHARDFATSFAYVTQARVIFRRRGDTAEDADCSYELGKLAAKARQLSAAVSYFEEASDLYHKVDRPIDEAWCYYRTALALRKLDNDDDPERRSDLPADYLTESRSLFKEAGDHDAEASCLMRLGEVLRDVNPSAAKLCLTEALRLLDSEKDARTRRTTAVLQELELHSKPSEKSAKAASEKRRQGKPGGRHSSNLIAQRPQDGP